jgi:hypothetical protein
MAILNRVILLLAILTLFLSVKPALAADNIKTAEFYIYDSDMVLNSSVSQDFSIYIGDNISTVANPIKSAYFKVSGTYTGAGTLNLTLDSDNSKTFTLPSAGNPTYFEFFYADTSSVINPATAGTFGYNLGLNKSGGLAIYGASVILNLTYQYAPAACPDGSSQKVKTTESYVYDSDVTLGSVSQDFTVYIGDNITAVSNPIKSAYFKISGTYTGAGTLNLTLNSGNAKTFTLPSASDPAYFEFFYADTSAIINPATAGTYSYNLGFNPSGVTIYGTSVKLDLTYQYIPPSCTGLPPTGELTSAIFDTTKTDVLKPAYNSIMWLGTFNSGNGRVRFQLATSDNSTGPWNYFGSPDNGITCNSSAWYDPTLPDTPIEITCAADNQQNNKRYFRYKVQICSNNDCLTSGSISPEVDDVIVNWAP